MEIVVGAFSLEHLYQSDGIQDGDDVSSGLHQEGRLFVLHTLEERMLQDTMVKFGEVCGYVF